MNWNDILVGIGSGGLSATIVAVIVKVYLATQMKRISSLENDLKSHKDEQFKELKVKVEKHIDQDCAQEIKTSLKIMNNSIEKMDAKLSRIAETTASQESTIKSQTTYLENLDKSIQRHEERCHAN